MIEKIFLLSNIFIQLHSVQFNCPRQCQCYEDIEEKSQAMHLICKWDQLNATNLESLVAPDLVRTLTIRCPHFSKSRTRPPAGLFQGLRNLDRLEIDRCLLHNVPENLFSGLHQLYSLIVKNAQLRDIPKALFSYIPNLMTLDMTGNDLRIEPYSLRSLGNLIHLDMSNNSINFLTNTLVSMDKLKVLTMDNNRLTNIDFRRLPEELTDLSLRHNFITTIHYVPNSVRSLRRIDLSGNMLDFLSGTGSINVLPLGLRQADLSNNRIGFLQDGAIAHITRLTLLDLRRNQLTNVKEKTVSSSKGKLRLFLSNNPLKCHCDLRWMIHSREKTSPVIVDLPQITCTHLLHRNQTLNLILADHQNELLCKYSNMCSHECTCCEDEKCPCLSTCPTGCQCFRSARLNTNKISHNVIICDNFRLDKIAVLPSTVSALHLNGSDWKELRVEKLQKLDHLRTLRISNTPMTVEEANSLSVLKQLFDVDLSSNRLSKFPSQLGYLSHLNISDNPLSEFTIKDLGIMENIKKLSFGGNRTEFSCSCSTPTPLQKWFQHMNNREKVEDSSFILCNMPPLGTIRLIDTLPGEGSLCANDTFDNIPWKYFAEGAVRQANTISSQIPLTTTTTTTQLHKLNEEKVQHKVPIQRLVTQTTRSTATTAITRTSITTTRFNQKYNKRNDEEHKIVNALIFILFVCVVILIIAISFTLYFRFIRIDSIPYQHKVQPHEAALLNR